MKALSGFLDTWRRVIGALLDAILDRHVPFLDLDDEGGMDFLFGQRHWNYRLVHLTDNGYDRIELREVHYHANRPYAHGAPALFTEIDEEAEGVANLFEKLERAFFEPVLEEADFLGQEA